MLGAASALAGCATPPWQTAKPAKPIPLAPPHRPPVKLAVTRPPPAPGPKVVHDPVETQPSQAAPQPEAAPQPPPEPQPEAQTAPAPAPAPEPQPAPAPPPPAAAAGPATLVGLSQGDVRGLLGEPATSGAAGPGQTWTYRSAECSLTLAFFYDVTRGAFFALSARAEPLPEPDCLARLRAAAHGT